MRVLLEFTPMQFVPFSKINKHTIQSMLYYHLLDTKYENYHNKKGFKYFTFSDIFPAKDFYPGKRYNLIVSSPISELIKTWYNSFKKDKYLYLSDEPFQITNVKKISMPLRNSFITGSPIVIYKDSQKNLYFSFKKDGDLKFFIERITENAIKKYNTFYNDDFTLEGPIFDILSFKKEVAINAKIENNEFNIIGSMWSLLKKAWIEKEDRKFYRFLMDCGVGEKNSLGFGFVNPIKEGK